MRKFLMAAALLAVAACGDKAAKTADSTPPAMAPTATTDTGMKKADTGAMKMPDSTMKKDTGTMAPKKP